MAARTTRASEARIDQTPALLVSRELVREDAHAYVMVADKALKYPRGSSRIAYIGNAGTGFWRVASSAAENAKEIFRRRAINEFAVYAVRTQRRRGVRTWVQLEASLLAAFRERYGSLPKCNRRAPKVPENAPFEDLVSVLKAFE